MGIRELDVGVRRVVEVDGTADRYFFQRHFPDNTVIQRRFTTAEDATWRLSRPATIEWCRKMGAHHVIDHHRPLDEALREAGIEQAEYVASLSASDRHQAAVAKLAPKGGDNGVKAHPGLTSIRGI